MGAPRLSGLIFWLKGPAKLISLMGCMLLALPSQVNAQPDLRFRRIGVEEGLPHNTVTSILQDRKGFMWFATHDGLCRYDGYSFRVFRNSPSDSTSISSNKVTSILEDRNGYIWAGTQAAGVNRFDPRTETFTRYRIYSAKTVSSDRVWVSDLLEDRQGNIWGTTFGEGLFLYDRLQGSFERFTHREGDSGSISSDDLNSLAMDAQGNVWVAAVGGLNRYDRRTRTFKRYLGGAAHSYDFRPEYLSELFFDKAGRLWIGTFGSGLLRFNPVDETVTQFRHNPADLQSLSYDVTYYKGMYEDRLGRIWISTNGGGLNLFEPNSGSFSSYKNEPSNQFSISNNVLAAIYEDNHGNVWIGGEGGLSVTAPFEERFALYQHHPAKPGGLSDNSIVCLLEDREGMLWIGTKAGGLNRYDRRTKTYKTYRHHPEQASSISSDIIQSVFEDRSGELWVGTDGGGWNRFNRETETFTRFYNAAYWQMLNDIHAIYEDKSGEFWLGTHGGLFSFDRRTGESVPYLHDPDNPRSISNDAIGRIFQDSRGTVWVSTWMGGLNRMNPRKAGEPPTFRHYRHDVNAPRSLSSDEVSVLFEDSKGNLWVGTADGLNLFEPGSGSFLRFGREAGFPSTFIYGILEDGKGDLWISTGNGLCRFNPQTGSVKVYDRKDGLQGNSFSGQFQLGAHCKSRTGEMFFGGPNGFNSFFPEQVLDNPHVPPIVITGFNVFNQPASLARPISELRQVTVPHTAKVISLDFAALDFRNPKKNLYAYRLEDFDRGWVNAGTRHSVSYTNLPSGTYTFRVKGSNNDGVWNETGAFLQLIVLPPWWRTWWAYLLYCLLFLGGMWGFVSYRSRSLRRENRELDRKVSQRTAEVVTQKEELQNTLEHLKATQSQLVQREKMASLGELTAGIAHEIQNPLNFVNNFSEVSSELVEELGQEASAGHKEGVLMITADLKHNLAKIHHHGQRADAIVRSMLQHSRASSGEKQRTDLIALVEEYLRLSYSGFRAKHKDFSCTLETAYDQNLEKVKVVPQELGRVLLNLFNNAFYAVQQKQKLGLVGYEPKVAVSTATQNGKAKIRVRDNGIGVPEKVIGKIFQPFFTTKPTGQGTGLGLSLSYDIITKGHGGELSVASKDGEWTEFILVLPYNP